MVNIFQGLIKSFFTVFMQALLNLLMGKLSTTVLQIVQDIGKNTDWSDEVKRKEAFAKIKLIAQNTGKDIRDSIVSLALEVAVSILKGNKV